MLTSAIARRGVNMPTTITREYVVTLMNGATFKIYSERPLTIVLLKEVSRLEPTGRAGLGDDGIARFDGKEKP